MTNAESLMIYFNPESEKWCVVKADGYISDYAVDVDAMEYKEFDTLEAAIENLRERVK